MFSFIFKGAIDLPQACIKMGVGGRDAARHDWTGRDLFQGLERASFSLFTVMEILSVT